MRELKEDSTRGRSYIKPKRYKRDALVQAWMDRRKIAMLSVWLDKNGYGTRFMSDVLKWTVEIVVNELVGRGEIERIETTEDANAILSKYRIDMNPGGRGEKNLTHNLVLDSKRSELEDKYSYADVDKPVAKGSMYAEARRLADTALAKYKEMEADGTFAKREKEQRDNDFEEQKNRAIESARASGRLVESEHEKKDIRPAKDHVIDVEESKRRALAEDERIRNADMMPPGYEDV